MVFNANVISISLLKKLAYLVTTSNSTPNLELFSNSKGPLQLSKTIAFNLQILIGFI